MDTILEFYNQSPTSFSIGQHYNLIEMILGLGYEQQLDKDTLDKLWNNVKSMDGSDKLKQKEKEFEIMKLDRKGRLEALERYMTNKDNKISAQELDNFCSGFTSRFLPIEVRREYYQAYFDHLLPALRKNTNMYAKKILIGLTPIKDSKDQVKASLEKIQSSLLPDEQFINDLIIKLGIL